MFGLHRKHAAENASVESEGEAMAKAKDQTEVTQDSQPSPADAPATGVPPVDAVAPTPALAPPVEEPFPEVPAKKPVPATLDLPEENAEAMYAIRKDGRLHRVKHKKVSMKLVAASSQDEARAAFVAWHAAQVPPLELKPKDCSVETLKP